MFIRRLRYVYLCSELLQSKDPPTDITLLFLQLINE